MTADEYIEFVLSSDDPFAHSVADPEFQALTREDQRTVVRRFGDYGLRDAVAERRKASIKASDVLE